MEQCSEGTRNRQARLGILVRARHGFSIFEGDADFASIIIVLPDLYLDSCQAFAFLAREDTVAMINHCLSMYGTEYLETIDFASLDCPYSMR